MQSDKVPATRALPLMRSVMQHQIDVIILPTNQEKRMNLVKLSGAILLCLLFGCASVPIESEELSNVAKEYNPPESGKSGIYVYRKDTAFGAALKKDVWIDSQCIGETARGVFFYHEVDGDQNHTISTESEFSPNDLVIFMQSGMHYFIEQYIKFGAFLGGAGVKEVDEAEGKTELTGLKKAKKGNCSKPG